MREKIEALRGLVQQGHAVLAGRTDDRDGNWHRAREWDAHCTAFLEDNFPRGEGAKFRAIRGTMTGFDPLGNFVRHMAAKLGFLSALVEEAGAKPEFWDKKRQRDAPMPAPDAADPLALLSRLCERFHAAAEPLLAPARDRAAWSLDDDAAVRDLMHVLLRAYLDDFRTQKVRASKRDGPERIDFLLHNDSVALVVRRMRPAGGVDDLERELARDIEKYKMHPSCKTVVAFVYDPDGRIPQPKDFEQRHTRIEAGLVARVIVSPKPPAANPK